MLGEKEMSRQAPWQIVNRGINPDESSRGGAEGGGDKKGRVRGRKKYYVKPQWPIINRGINSNESRRRVEIGGEIW